MLMCKFLTQYVSKITCRLLITSEICAAIWVSAYFFGEENNTSLTKTYAIWGEVSHAILLSYQLKSLLVSQNMLRDEEIDCDFLTRCIALNLIYNFK